MLMKANPETMMFELFEAGGGVVIHDPFVCKENVAEQFWHVVEVQLAQFAEQAWHPGIVAK